MVNTRHIVNNAEDAKSQRRKDYYVSTAPEDTWPALQRDNEQ